MLLRRFDTTCGQAGERILGRVEAGLADLLLVGALAGEGQFAAATVCPPATAAGDLSGLLHIRMDHMTGIADADLPWRAEVLAVRGDVTDPVQSQTVQPPRLRPHGA